MGIMKWNTRKKLENEKRPKKELQRYRYVTYRMLTRIIEETIYFGELLFFEESTFFTTRYFSTNHRFPEKNLSSYGNNKNFFQQLSAGEKSTTSSIQVVETPSLKRKAPQVVKPKVRLDENGDIIVDKSSLYVQEENAR